MVKTEVFLCDKCKNRIASRKCYYCKEDICGRCGEEICATGTISLFVLREVRYSDEKGSKIYLCSGCKEKFRDAFKGLQGEEKGLLIRDLLTTYIQHLTISKLKVGEKENGG